MPLLGKFFARDGEAYRYLFRSTQGFEPPDSLANRLLGLGLRKVRTRRLGLGSVMLLTAQKP